MQVKPKQNEDLLQELIKLYNKWPQDDGQLLQKLESNKNQTNFLDVVSYFKQYINSYDNYHPARYVNTLLFRDGTRYVGKSAEFRQLNDALNVYIPQQNFFDQASAFGSLLLSGTKKLLDYFVEHPVQLFLLGSMINLPAVTASTKNGTAMHMPGASDTSLGFIANTTVDSHSNSYGTLDNPTEMLALTPKPSTIDKPQSSTSKLKKMIKKKMIIDPRYAEKLTSVEQEQTKDEMVDVVTKFIDQPENAKTLKHIYDNNSFKLRIVDNFPDAPEGAGVGVYRIRQNEIHIQDPKKIKYCNDVVTTFQHEKEHAKLAALRSKGDLSKHGLFTLTDPFTNDREQNRLKIAIKRGDKRVTETFADLYHKNLQQTLTPDQVDEYNKLIVAASDYQPRCVSEPVYMSDEDLHHLQQKIQAGEKVLINHIYATSVFKLPNGVIVAAGHHVADINDPMQIPHAIIMDTQWRMNQYQGIYAGNQGITNDQAAEKMALKEAHAEINANSPAFVGAFYKELDVYNKELEKNILAESKGTSLSPTPKPGKA